ncbi:hypothetical protein ACWDG9_38075 [Streptomyces sp. NPDC001073]
MPPELIDIDGPRGVEADRAGPSEIVQGCGTDRLRTNIDDVSFVDDGVTALHPTAGRRGKTIIRIRP